jgi:hypothetical protein
VGGGVGSSRPTGAVTLSSAGQGEEQREAREGLCSGLSCDHSLSFAQRRLTTQAMSWLTERRHVPHRRCRARTPQRTEMVSAFAGTSTEYHTVPNTVDPSKGTSSAASVASALPTIVVSTGSLLAVGEMTSGVPTASFGGGPLSHTYIMNSSLTAGSRLPTCPGQRKGTNMHGCVLCVPVHPRRLHPHPAF